MHIHFYSDNGHGWAAVERSTLTDLGIADKISSASYQRGEIVYLEEDADLSTFVAALRAQGTPIEFIEHNVNGLSPIRNYHPYVVSCVSLRG